MNRKALIALLATLLSICAMRAMASAVTFDFAGIITQIPVLDPDDPFGGTICDGSNCSSVSTFSGSYTFDSAASDVPARYPRAQLCDQLIR